MELNKIKKSIQNLIKINLLKKIFLTSGTIVAIGTALTSCHGNLGNKKYDIKEFSIIDTLEIDTIDESPTIDHLYNYIMSDRKVNLKKYTKYKILKEDLEFGTTCRGFIHHGSLRVSKKEEFRYKPVNTLEIDSEEIKEKNYVVHKFYSLDKNLKINELSIYGAEFKEGNPYFGLERTYTRDTDLGNKILDNEQAEVKKYLEKIEENKKIKGLWKD